MANSGRDAQAAFLLLISFEVCIGHLTDCAVVSGPCRGQLPALISWRPVEHGCRARRRANCQAVPLEIGAGSCRCVIQYRSRHARAHIVVLMRTSMGALSLTGRVWAGSTRGFQANGTMLAQWVITVCNTGSTCYKLIYCSVTMRIWHVKQRHLAVQLSECKCMLHPAASAAWRHGPAQYASYSNLHFFYLHGVEN
jgi:hypothetical protein